MKYVVRNIIFIDAIASKIIYYL